MSNIRISNHFVNCYTAFLLITQFIQLSILCLYSNTPAMLL